MGRRIAARIGASYAWGLINYAFGVASGAFLAGFTRGLDPIHLVHHLL